jgi:hypothetical protein
MPRNKLMRKKEESKNKRDKRSEFIKTNCSNRLAIMMTQRNKIGSTTLKRAEK